MNAEQKQTKTSIAQKISRNDKELKILLNCWTAEFYLLDFASQKIKPSPKCCIKIKINSHGVRAKEWNETTR